MKKILTILFLLIAATTFGQPYTYHLRYDSVKFTTANNSEFILRSSTRDTTNGILLNLGGGITQFKRIRAISATQFTVGTDTITITGSGGGGGTYTEGYGIDITSNVVTADTSILGPLWRSQFAPNLIIQNAGTGQQSWWASGDTLYQKRFGNTLGLSWATSADSSLIPTIDSAIWVHKSSTGQITGAKTFTQDVQNQRNGNPAYYYVNRMGTTGDMPLGGIQFQDKSVTKLYLWGQNFGDTAFVLKFGQGSANKSWAVEDKFGHMALGYSTYERDYAFKIAHRAANFGADSSLMLGGLHYKWFNAAGNGVDSFKVDKRSNIIATGYLSIEDVDSVGTAINMVYQGADKKFYKAAVPSGSGGISDGDKGDITVSASGATWTIDNTAVTLAKIANASASSKLLGSGASGSGASYAEITLGTGLTMTGTTLSSSGGSGTPGSNYNDIIDAIGTTIKGETLTKFWEVSVGLVLTDAQVRYFPIWIREAGTITGAEWWQHVVGNYTADAANEIKLMTYSAGTVTEVATTGNVAALWQTSTSSSLRQAAFTSTYSASAGLHYLAILYNNSAQTTAPQIGINTPMVNANLAAIGLSNSAKISGNLNAQTAITSPQALSGVTANASNIWFAVY